MANELTKIQKYFDRDAEDYDAYFSQDKGPKSIGRYLAKNLLSRDAHERRLGGVIDLIGDDVDGLKILEVGCGPGRYGLELVRRGARLVGLDFAPGMIKIAETVAEKEGLAEHCRFVVGDILDHEFDETFDIAFATGVLDYIPAEHRVELVRRMGEVATRAVIISFPKRWVLHAFLRKIWLTLKGVPVYYYTQKDIDRLFAAAGLVESGESDAGILTVKKAVPKAS